MNRFPTVFFGCLLALGCSGGTPDAPVGKVVKKQKPNASAVKPTDGVKPKAVEAEAIKPKVAKPASGSGAAGATDMPAPLVLKGHITVVNAVAWRPDGWALASISADGTAQIWNPITGKETAKLEGLAGAGQSVAWPPDGSTLATGDYWNIHLWDAATGMQTARWRAHHKLSRKPDPLRFRRKFLFQIFTGLRAAGHYLCGND